MPKKYRQSFIVRGSVSFPIDMLRYDHCFPDTEQDSHQITETINYRDILSKSDDSGWTIVVARYVDSFSDKPTFDRWRSFCVQVDENTLRTVKL